MLNTCMHTRNWNIICKTTTLLISILSITLPCFLCRSLYPTTLLFFSSFYFCLSVRICLSLWLIYFYLLWLFYLLSIVAVLFVLWLFCLLSVYPVSNPIMHTVCASYCACPWPVFLLPRCLSWLFIFILFIIKAVKAAHSMDIDFSPCELT